jgi:hypothetical protein
MAEFLNDMLPVKQKNKELLPIKSIAGILAEYFGYSKSEKLSLIDFLEKMTTQKKQSLISKH